MYSNLSHELQISIYEVSVMKNYRPGPDTDTMVTTDIENK